MYKLYCVEVSCPFKDCKYHFHKRKHIPEGSFAGKLEYKNLSSTCNKYQKYHEKI